jgi:uncharacterized protein (DUF608 family)
MRFHSRTDHLTTISLGGLGTGSIELDVKGGFSGWTIFNNRPWSDYGSPEKYFDKDDLVFILRVYRDDETPYLLILRTEPWFSRYNYDHFSSVNDALNPYQTPWVRNIESLEVIATPPKIKIIYRDRWLEKSGLEIYSEIYSLLLPGDLKISTTPALIIRFVIRNIGDKKTDVSLISILRNPHNFTAQNVAINRLIRSNRYVGVKMFGENIPENHGMFNGALAIVITDVSGSAASFELDLSSRWSYTEPLRRLLVEYRREGVLKADVDKKVVGEKIGLYGSLSRKLEIDPGEIKEIIFILAWYYPNHIDRFGNKLGHYYENYYKNVEEVLEFVAEDLKRIIEKINRFVEVLYSGSYEDYLKELAVSQITTLSKSTWLTKEGFFGVWEGGPGTCAGLNTVDVAYYALPTILLLYPELGKRLIVDWTNHILTPDKSPYYEVFSLAFPENMSMYRDMLRKDPSIQHDLTKFRDALKKIIEKTRVDASGRVMHCYTASPYYVDTYDRNDLMPEYLLQTYLVYEWIGDREFLNKILDHIKLVIEGTLRQHDPLDTGLIYHFPPSGYEGFSQIAKILRGRGVAEDLMRSLFSGPMYVPISVNTFDNLSFHGIASFTSELWLSALKKSIEIFTEIGDLNYAEHVKKIFDKASENMIRYLWNGEYLDNWFDPLSGLRDKAVMSASLSGEWYLENLMSSGYILEHDKIISILRSIYKYNYNSFEGLLNATYPGERRPGLYGDLLYPNNTGILYTISSQPDTPWTGVEIMVALQMIWEGMEREGLEILRNVHERYLSWGMYYNHMECDGHYFRALISLQIFNHLAGFRFSGRRKFIEISPRHPRNNFRGPIMMPSSVAQLVYEDSAERLHIKLEIKIGDPLIKIRELIIHSDRKIMKTKIMLNNKEIFHKYLYEDEKKILRILLEEEISLKEGDLLEVYAEHII